MSELNKIIEKCTAGEMPFCQPTCPLHADMKGAIALIRDGKFDEALQLIRETLPFLGFRADLQSPREDVCQRKEVEERISIMCLKRSAVHYAEESDWDLTIPGEKKERIAVIGVAPLV